MSKLTIDCPICLNFHHKKTTFRLCAHEVCNECAYQMMTKQMQCCPLCRQKIKLNLIPETIIVIDDYYEKEYKTKPKIKKPINTTNLWYMTINTNYDVPENTKYYDADDSDYDSDNDGMN